ncbi:MAG: PQQ-binding-like beta-propeller repeat protein [Bacteroidales bacterium]
MKNLKIVFVLVLILASCSGKENIYEWRGNGRTGIYREANLLKKWPVDGPKKIWTVDNIGNGFTSPIITRNSFIIAGEADSMSILYCFNLKGKKLWQTTLGKEWTKSFPGSRCTPTVVGDLIYAGTGLGNLYCVSRKNGKIIWLKDLIKDFNGVLPLHGYSEAPLIDGDKVFWTPGGKEYNVVALNRFTGKLIWTNKGFGEASAYNPPKLIVLPSRNILVTFSSYHLMGFDTKTGKLFWAHEQDNYPLDKRAPGYGDTHANTVLFEKGSIYYVEGDGNCAVKLNLSSDGTTITEVWRNKKFDSYMGGIIKSGDYMYANGSERPLLMAINATTGELTDSLKIGTGTLISADNMLYYYNQKGDLMLLSYDKGKMQMVSSFRIKEGTNQHFSHPVISNGILYLRHGKTLIAYDIRKK